MKQDLLGRWNLESYETPSESGALIRMTQGQTGTLEYRADGRMSVVIDRDPAELKRLGLNPRLTHLHYSGRFTVDEKAGTVSHHVEEADHAERVGKVLVRKFHLQGDRLELSGQGLEASVKLSWIKDGIC